MIASVILHNSKAIMKSEHWLELLAVKRYAYRDNYRCNIRHSTKGKFSTKSISSDRKIKLLDKIKLLFIFHTYTWYPEHLREPISIPGKYEHLSKGIPLALYITPNSFSELENIVNLQEAASELDNNCTTLLEPIPDPFEEPSDILPIQDTGSEAIDPQEFKILLVLKLEIN